MGGLIKSSARSWAFVAEEADESLFWLEAIAVDMPRVQTENYNRLVGEADELTAIFTKSYQTSKDNLEKKKREKKNRKSPNH